MATTLICIFYYIVRNQCIEEMLKRASESVLTVLLGYNTCRPTHPTAYGKQDCIIVLANSLANLQGNI